MEDPLNDIELLQGLDKKGMLDIISRSSENAFDAIRIARKTELKIKKREHDALVITGMGGSAVGGLLLRDWLKETSKTPIFVSRGYHLPAWVNQDTLVFCVSYSGETEETLSQFDEAYERGCSIVVFSSGGELLDRAIQNKLTNVRLPEGYQPRAAISYQFFCIATITDRFGYVESWSEVEETLSILKQLSNEMAITVPADSNPGKQLARSIYGYIPMVYGGSIHESIAYRYSTQFNENSKSPASTNFFPEAFHNSIMAREASENLTKQLCAIIIVDPEEAAEITKKIKRFVELIAEKFGRVVTVEARGKSKLARMLSALYIGDYASCYLGLIYGHDPSTTHSIDILKGEKTR